MRLRFGDYALDTEQRALFRAGVEVRLEPKVFDCLALLMTDAGRLTSTQQLREALWPGVHVGDGALRRIINEARKALGDTGEAQAIIVTRKRRGYSFVPRVVVEATETGTLASRAAAKWPFVGRARELERMRAWVGASGTGGVCLLSGEAGVGKSSLLGNFASEDAGRAVWLFGRCQPTLGTPAFWPFRELAQRMLRDARVGARARALAAHYPDLALILPELSAGRTTPNPPARLDAERRFELSEAFAALLSSLSQTWPLRLGIEDVHWADAGSLALLDAVARAAQERPLHVLATYRPEEVSEGHALPRWLGRWSGRAGVCSVHLGPLGADELAALLEQLQLPAATVRAVPKLLQRSGGNALYVHELLQHALQDLPLPAAGEPRGEQAGAAEALLRLERLTRPAFVFAEAPTPGLVHVVSERVSALAEITQQRLREAAVLGGDFAVDVLAQVAGVSSAAVWSELEPALRAGLLQQCDSQPERCRFHHALVRDALLSSLSPHQRQRQHCAALRAIRERADADASAAALAQHAFESGDLVPQSERRQLCEQAGREAFARLAFDRAALELGRALQLTAAADHSLAKAALALSWAQARWHADDRASEVKAAFLLAAEHARRAGSAEVLAEAAIGHACCNTPALAIHSAALRPRARELTDEAWAGLAGDAERLRQAPQQLAFRLAMARCWQRVDVGDVADCQRAAELAISLAGTQQELWVLALRAVAQPTRALDMAKEILVRAPESELSPSERMDVLVIAMGTFLAFGDLAGWEQAAGAIARLAEQLHLPERPGERLSHYLGVQLCVPVTRAVITGELAAAEAYVLGMFEPVQRLGLSRTPEGDRNIFYMFLQLYGYLGRSRELEPLFERTAAAEPQQHWFAALLRTQFALECGDRARASENFAHLRASGFRPLLGGTPVPARLETLLRLAHACVQIGTPADAQIIRDALTERAAWYPADGAFISWGSGARPLAALAHQLHLYSEAEEQYAHALAQNRRLGHRPELVRTQLGLAQLLIDLGRRAEAHVLLDAAQPEALAMNMAPMVELARRLAAG